MLVVTARLFKDNQLVGYEVVGYKGRKYQLTKQELWTYAKKKDVLNVVASGTVENPIISGTNGFELKSLPQIKWQAQPANNVKYNAQDILSSGIRLILSGAKISAGHQVLDIYKQHLKEEVQSGKINASQVRSLSKYFKVLNTLDDPTKKGGNIIVAIPTGEELEKQRQQWLEEKDKNISLFQNIIGLCDQLINTSSEIINTSGKVEATAGELVAKVDLKWLINLFVKSSTLSELNELVKTLQELDDMDPNKLVNLQESISAFTEVKDDITQVLLTLQESEFTPQKTLVATSPVIGYRIQYTGTTPVNTFRMTVTVEHKIIPFTINPGDIVCLSRAETSILCSQPEIGCTFANGKLERSSKRVDGSDYDCLSSNYFAFSSEAGMSVNDSSIKKHVTDFVDAETTAKYFIPSENHVVQANKDTHQQESIKKLQNSKSVKDIFNAFKR